MGTDGKNSALFCECKWTNEKVVSGVLETLIKRSKLFYFTNTNFYIFSMTGFTKGCLDKATEIGNVNLITFDQMMK